MIKTLTEKLKEEKQKQVFKFKRTNGIAGICPDCGEVITFNYFTKFYECTNKSCLFLANENCERVWENTLGNTNGYSIH